MKSISELKTSKTSRSSVRTKKDVQNKITGNPNSFYGFCKNNIKIKYGTNSYFVNKI